MGKPPGVGAVVHEFGLTAELSLSFQRYPLPKSAVLHDLPRSWGALPLAVAGPGHLLLPVPEGEGAWLGLLPDRRGPGWSVRVVALLSTLGATDAVTGRAVGEGEPATALPVPPNRSLPGIASDSGAWRALTRTAPGADAPGCRELTVRASPVHRAGGFPEVSVLVELVAPADFERRTGNAVPQLRPDAPYGGRQLP